MAAGDGSFRSRAASLLPNAQHSIRRSLRRDSNLEKPVLSPKTHHPDRANEENTSLPALEKTQTHTSSGGTHHTSGTDAVAHDREAQRIVRTVPTWVHTFDEDDEDLLPPTSPRPPTLPIQPHIAHHNTTPAFFGQSHPTRGKLFDRDREWTPPLPRGPVQETGSRWRAFATSSAYPPISANLLGGVINEDLFARLGPDYSRPWLADLEGGDPEKGNASNFRSHFKRRAWYEKFARIILRSPLVPLVIRMVVFCFSMVALALACSIHHLTYASSTPSTDQENNIRSMSSDQSNGIHSQASTLMAIVVDAVAMVYLLGITYDEYSGKPLGLRPASAKMRLIFLDLFFIVFDSANLSLAFEALGDTSSCGMICHQQRALASVLLIALIAWLMTFSISVMRVVERVHG